MRSWIRALCLALLLFSAPAWAANEWGITSGCEDDNSVGSSGVICFSFNENVVDESETVFVVADYAIAIFDGNLASATTSTATAEIYSCTPNAVDTTDCAQVCGEASCTFDSTPGLPSAQKEAVLLPAGTYRLKIKTVPGAGETGLFYVRGIKP